MERHNGRETALEVRRYLAWKSIMEEQDILNLDAHQRRQAQDSMKRSNDTVDLRLREAYSWLLVPAQEAGGAWQWEATRIPGDGSIPHRASRKLRDSEQLIHRVLSSSRPNRCCAATTAR